MPAMPKWGRKLLWVLPLVIAPAVLIAVGPWLKAIDRSLLHAAGFAMAIFVMGYATYLSILWQRGLDEVHLAGTRFSAEWGALAGIIAFVLLLNLSPFRYLATTMTWDWAGYPEDPGAGKKVVTLAMTFAFCAVVILQTLGRLVVNIFWWKSQQ